MSKKKKSILSPADEIVLLFSKAIRKSNAIVRETEFESYFEQSEAEEIAARLEAAVLVTVRGGIYGEDEEGDGEERVAEHKGNVVNIFEARTTASMVQEAIRVAGFAEVAKEYDPKGWPLNTAPADMTDGEQILWWKHQSRKHEARAKKYYTESNELRSQLVEASKPRWQRVMVNRPQVENLQYLQAPALDPRAVWWNQI
jgi:hypothetical protein